MDNCQKIYRSVWHFLLRASPGSEPAGKEALTLNRPGGGGGDFAPSPGFS